MEAVIQRQRANYARFRKLFRAARKLDNYLGDADKTRLGVVVHRLDKRATTSSEPQFFEPMQSEVFRGLPGPDFTFKPDSVDIGVTYSKYGERSRVELDENQIPGVSDYEWRADEFYGVDEDAEFPHIVLFSVHGLDMGESDDQRITRGELVLILKLFMERMILPIHAEHEIYPILMVSFFKLNVRLLQAHFDGEFLHIRCSSFLDLSTDSKENKELLLRWIMSTPVGNTREPTKPVASVKASTRGR